MQMQSSAGAEELIARTDDLLREHTGRREFGEPPPEWAPVWSRFSDGYDAFLYADGRGMGLCACCSFVTYLYEGELQRGMYGSEDLEEYLRHVARHRNQKQYLPPDVEARIRQGWYAPAVPTTSGVSS